MGGGLGLVGRLGLGVGVGIDGGEDDLGGGGVMVGSHGDLGITANKENALSLQLVLFALVQSLL